MKGLLLMNEQHEADIKRVTDSRQSPFATGGVIPPTDHTCDRDHVPAFLDQGCTYSPALIAAAERLDRGEGIRNPRFRICPDCFEVHGVGECKATFEDDES